ncbi:MAG: SPOR domain-containing protein [Hyphomicrobiales bacterium]|nr:SPOR domain-containing protein [Hyphomicrobiales bacterium]
MTSSNNSVQPLDLDDLERQLREVAVASIPRKSDDPLAELARIVGRDNPPRTASSGAQNSTGSSEKHFDLESSIKDALRADPAYEPHDDDAEESAFEEDGADIRDEVDDEADGEAHLTSRDWEEDDYEGETAHAGEAGRFDDVEDVPGIPEEGSHDTPARRGWVSPRALALAVPLVLIGVGVGAAVVMRSGPMARISGGEAPLIKADDTPVKVLPANVAGDQETPSETALGAADPSGKPSQVTLTRAEQPVDVVAAARAAQPRDPAATQPPAGSGVVILSGPGASNASGPADAAVSPGLTPSAPSAQPLPTSAASVVLPEPPQPASQNSTFGTLRRVATVSIKPDGTPNGKPKADLAVKPDARSDSKPEAKADSAPAPASAPAKPPMALASAETTSPPSVASATTSATPSAKKPADTTHSKPSAAVTTDDQPDTQGSKPSKATVKPVKPKPAETASVSQDAGNGAPLSITPAGKKGRTTVAKAEPVNPESAASAISAAATQTPSAGSAFAQVASSQSESDARATLARLQKQFPGELGGGAIHRADLGSKGIYYRVQVGPVSREAADKICTQLKASGAQCIRTGG